MKKIKCSLCKKGGNYLYQSEHFNRIILCHPCLLRLQVGITQLMGEAFLRDLEGKPAGFFHALTSESNHRMWCTDHSTAISMNGKEVESGTAT